MGSLPSTIERAIALISIYPTKSRRVIYGVVPVIIFPHENLNTHCTLYMVVANGFAYNLANVFDKNRESGQQTNDVYGQTELMFMGIFSIISALLGLSKLQMTPMCKENLSLFTSYICPPSGGKNQCFSFGCKQPVTLVEEKQGKCLWLDKFTEAGLRQHLIQNDGITLTMNKEMEDTLQNIQIERECGTLCLLFNRDSLYTNNGSHSSRQTIEQTSVSIGK